MYTWEDILNWLLFPFIIYLQISDLKNDETAFSCFKLVVGMPKIEFSLLKGFSFH